MPIFEDLRVCRKAYELTLQVYSATQRFPKHELYGLTAQMRHAAVSIGANLAEGQKRGTKREFSRFVSFSEGSLAELQFYLKLARDLSFLAPEEHDSLLQASEVVERMLVGLQKRLREIAPPQRPHDAAVEPAPTVDSDARSTTND